MILKTAAVLLSHDLEAGRQFYVVELGMFRVVAERYDGNRLEQFKDLDSRAQLVLAPHDGPGAELILVDVPSGTPSRTPLLSLGVADAAKEFARLRAMHFESGAVLEDHFVATPRGDFFEMFDSSGNRIQFTGPPSTS